MCRGMPTKETCVVGSHAPRSRARPSNGFLVPGPGSRVNPTNELNPFGPRVDLFSEIMTTPVSDGDVAIRHVGNPPLYFDQS